MQRVLFVFILVGLSVVARVGGAEPHPGAETMRARALFAEGLDHADAGRWAEAADRFESARAIRDTPEITYNLTTALLELGQLARARRLLEPLASTAQGSPEVRAAAAARLAVIDQKVAQGQGREPPMGSGGFAAGIPVAGSPTPAAGDRGLDLVPSRPLAPAAPADTGASSGRGRGRGWVWAVVGAVALGVTTATVIALRDEPDPVMGNVATWMLGEK